MKSGNIKNAVKEKYSQIARESDSDNSSSCCGPTNCCGSDLEISMIGDEYKDVKGYNPDADLGLGCGVPTEFAGLKPGQHVLDLGSGAGNDCFVVRTIVGDNGHVTGLDFSEEMVEKARQNTKKLGYDNLHFLTGDIEEMPLEATRFDVVISNCVLNLVPDKSKAFNEIFRVLKSGGSFCISDVVTVGNLPESLLKSAEMYAGCVAGAISKDKYIRLIENSGFKNIQIHKEKEIILPDEILADYLNKEEVNNFNNAQTGIYSITITAKKEVK